MSVVKGGIQSIYRPCLCPHTHPPPLPTIDGHRLVKGELRIARKHPGCAEQAQREIYDWVREGVAQGMCVDLVGSYLVWFSLGFGLGGG